MSKFEDFLRIYNIYRDHVKHEDTLLNQRLSFLIASQSFLFLPYFRVLKEFLSNGNNKNYDLFLLFLLLSLICFLGVFINNLTKDSIQGYVDASTNINQKWKTELSQKWKNDIQTKDINNLDFLTFSDSDSDKKCQTIIPNIRYENQDPKLNNRINKFRDNMPRRLEEVWCVLWIASFIFLLMQICCQNWL